MRLRSTLLATAGLLAAAASASAHGWSYPREISVAEAYNRLYCTDFNTRHTSGLDELIAAQGEEARPAWTIYDVEKVRLLVRDTSVSGTVDLLVYAPGGAVTLPLFDAGRWTAPTRGWLPNRRLPVVDLPSFLEENGFDREAPFSFVMGNQVADANNAVVLAGQEPGESLLAYNDGGLEAGDGDANDAVLQLFAPQGQRLAWCPEGYNVIVGTEGDDHLVGTDGNDCIYGLGGNDLVRGLGGDDRLYGGSGHDEVRGWRGNDLVYGGTCDDFVRGGAGDDQVNGDAGYDLVFGGAGNDLLRGGDDDDELYGFAGVDGLFGGDGNDLLFGGDDPDQMHGGNGYDWLVGGSGEDVMDGGRNEDILEGGRDGDYLFGGPGMDALYGQGGVDYLSGGQGMDNVVGGDGNDFLDGASDFDRLAGQGGSDICLNGEWVRTCESTTAPVETPVAASFVAGVEPGLRKDGAAVLPERAAPEAALAFEPANVEGGFYSLGLGGNVAVGFGRAILNGPGADLRLYEKTYGPYPAETADVYAWDPAEETWVLLGAASSRPAEGANTYTDFDLGDLPFIWTVLVVDTTDAAPHAGDADGFDLNGVIGLHPLP